MPMILCHLHQDYHPKFCTVPPLSNDRKKSVKSVDTEYTGGRGQLLPKSHQIQTAEIQPERMAP